MIPATVEEVYETTEFCNAKLRLDNPMPTGEPNGRVEYLSAINTRMFQVVLRATGNEQEPILQFFSYAHLPARLQAVSKPFGDLAHAIVVLLPRNPERTVALRKLLESKDAAVRASLMK